MTFCEKLWYELRDKIARIAYQSEEENKEKGAIIYQKTDGTLVFGHIYTGTECEIHFGLEEEPGKSIASFHTHPMSFFTSEAEEHLVEAFWGKRSPFSSDDLLSAFNRKHDAECVIGKDFVLHCLEGIQKLRTKQNLQKLKDLMEKRWERKLLVEDIELLKTLGLTYCKRGIEQAVYKIAREAKKTLIKHLT